MKDSFEKLRIDGNETRFRQFVPEPKYSEILSPLNTPVDMLSEIELQERRVALDAISGIRTKPIPNIGVN